MALLSRRAVFVDRDGTLIAERNYLADPGQVEFLPGAVEGMRRLKQAGWALVIVTNQSGIARGLYTAADFHAVQDRVERELAAAGAAVDGSWFCPHHPDFGGPCACRKPGTALFEQAAHALALDLRASAFVGDRLRDVAPGIVLGGRAILVRTGYGAEEAAGAGPGIEVAADFADAAARILQG